MSRRLIVEVRGGPLRGHKAIVEPGSTLRIGKAERADLVIDDARLSPVHLSLTWDGASCRLVDHDSRGGTTRNGKAVRQAELVHGDWLRAGETDLLVYFEGAAQARAAEPDGAAAATRARALGALRSEREPLYAVLDAARDDRVLQLLRESVEMHRSLYDGVEGEALDDVAPYLVRLPSGSRLLEQLVEEGWGGSWGIYLTSTASPTALRRHLRRFLVVANEATGREVYFRFYDPRVLRVFLPTCSTLQLGELFGEVRTFVLEGADGGVVRFDAPG
jgi:hypothetical protein